MLLFMCSLCECYFISSKYIYKILYFESYDTHVLKVNTSNIFFSDWSKIDDLVIEVYLNMPDKLLHPDYTFKPENHLCGINISNPYTIKMINEGPNKFKIGLLTSNNEDVKSLMENFSLKFKIPENYLGELIYDYDQPKKVCRIIIILVVVILTLYLCFQLLLYFIYLS